VSSCLHMRGSWEGENVVECKDDLLIKNKQFRYRMQVDPRSWRIRGSPVLTNPHPKEQ
jgi:hypothetical protein